MTKLTIYLFEDPFDPDTPTVEVIEVEEWLACPGHLYYATPEKRVLIPWHRVRRVEGAR